MYTKILFFIYSKFALHTDKLVYIYLFQNKNFKDAECIGLKIAMNEKGDCSPPPPKRRNLDESVLSPGTPFMAIRLI